MPALAPALSQARHQVLQRYGRAIVHMRQQMAVGHFGLVLGAGASKDLGFPDWDELVKRIAADRRVAGQTLLKRAPSATSRTQLLYQRLRTREQARSVPGDGEFNRFEAKLAALWRTIVHGALYRKVPANAEELLARDTYLQAFLGVIRRTRLTINYNFDDSVQRMLSATRSADERDSTRGYTTVWSPDIQMYPKLGVIYHPNGYLPLDMSGERPSEQLVFLEDTFADQLIASMHGHYMSLAYHLVESTRLFLGMSLSDPTVRHLLRQHAGIYHGHFHYYVAFVEDGAAASRQYDQAIADANFNTYNLITLFLTRMQIRALGELLTLPDDEFAALADEQGKPVVFRFLVTGAVSVGKSTTISQFRSLQIHDEWLEARAPGMDRDYRRVKGKKIEHIDAWVARQVALKNLNMIQAKPGIHIVDRAPLDAFAFTRPGQWRSKARRLRRAVSPGRAKRRLCPAHVILLRGDRDVMAARCLARQKDMRADHLEQQQATLTQIYQEMDGVTVIDTRDKSVAQICREVANVIHRREPYVEAPLQERLERFGTEGVNACAP